MTDQNITEYVKNNLELGVSKDQIYKDLLNQGLSLQQIENNYYQVSSNTSATDSRKRTVNVIVIFGAILIGAGIFSFIASNWQGLSSVGKVFIILAAIIIFY